MTFFPSPPERQPALAMPPIDKIIGHPVFFGGLILAMIKSGHAWWFEDAHWGWFAFFWCAASASASALDDIQKTRRRTVSHPDSKPPLRVRFFGHPLIAWPVICVIAPFLITLCLQAYEQQELWQPHVLILLWMFLSPIIIFLGWNHRRRAWKLGMRAVVVLKDRLIKTTPVPSVPIASVIIPTIAVSPPDISHAMQRLPPALLALIREGMIAEQSGTAA